MKRVLFLFLAFVMAGGFAFSVDLMEYPPPLEGGNILVDAGVGYAFASGLGATIKIPPVVASAEYCLPTGVPISLGALAGFYQFEWRYLGTASWVETWTYATFGARANWHWNIDASWLDLYTGAFVGYTYFKWSSDSRPYDGYIQPYYGGIDFGGQVGAHFYFTKHIGAVLEFGFPFAAKAGVALKF